MRLSMLGFTAIVFSVGFLRVQKISLHVEVQTATAAINKKIAIKIAGTLNTVCIEVSWDGIGYGELRRGDYLWRYKYEIPWHIEFVSMITDNVTICHWSLLSLSSRVVMAGAESLLTQCKLPLTAGTGAQTPVAERRLPKS